MIRRSCTLLVLCLLAAGCVSSAPRGATNEAPGIDLWSAPDLEALGAFLNREVTTNPKMVPWILPEIPARQAWTPSQSEGVWVLTAREWTLIPGPSDDLFTLAVLCQQDRWAFLGFRRISAQRFEVLAFKVDEEPFAPARERDVILGPYSSPEERGQSTRPSVFLGAREREQTEDKKK